VVNKENITDKQVPMKTEDYSLYESNIKFVEQREEKVDEEIKNIRSQHKTSINTDKKTTSTETFDISKNKMINIQSQK